MLTRLLIAVIGAASFITFGSVAWGLVLQLDKLPLWMWLIVCVSYAISALGVLALADSRR